VKRGMKVALILMATLTLLYVIVIVFAYVNTDSDQYVDPTTTLSTQHTSLNQIHHPLFGTRQRNWE
jgi:hypothetical protein